MEVRIVLTALFIVFFVRYLVEWISAEGRESSAAGRWAMSLTLGYAITHVMFWG